MGTPPADLVATAGSSVPRGHAVPPIEPVRDTGSVGGVGGERVSARGRSPLCGGAGAEPPHSGAPPGAPSSLDTNDITRPDREKSARGKWLEGVEVHTATFREERARSLEAKAARKRRALREEGFSESYVADRLRWHTSRARGERERFERVSECGTERVLLVCLGCGVNHEQRGGCRARLLCVGCRGAIASEKRLAFLAARQVVLADAEKRGLLRPNRRGGRWGEKLLTLTLPHIEGQSIDARIELAFSVWTRFLRYFNNWLRERDAQHGVHWYRVFEWTIGNDASGHPHFHVWLFAPFIERALIVEWWRDGILALGVDVSDPVVDIRAAQSQAGLAQELIKYLVKDLGAGGGYVPADLFAEVYVVLCGHRTTQASRGFLKLGKVDKRCACGAQAWDRRKVPASSSEE